MMGCTDAQQFHIDPVPDSYVSTVNSTGSFTGLCVVARGVYRFFEHFPLRPIDAGSMQ